MVDFGGQDPECGRVLDRLEQAARNATRGSLLLGIIGPLAFFDPSCNPSALDRIAPGDEVVLWTWTPHAAILNQAAGRKLRIIDGNPPPLGGFFGKDMNSKKWDGVVHEGAWFRIYQLLMSDRAGEQAKLRGYLDREAQWGVTSITLMEVEPAGRIELLAAIDSPMRIRVVPFLSYQEQDQRRKPQYPRVPAALADRVSVSGVKWLLDGTPVERSAAMRKPYADNPNSSGQMVFRQRNSTTSCKRHNGGMFSRCCTE